MAYNADIPQANDNPSESQGQILGNFQALNTFLAVNHVSLNDGDEGKHTFLQMPEQSSAPSTAADEVAVYAKEYNSVASLFFRQESSGTEQVLTAPTTFATAGRAYFGGLLVQWNRVSVTSFNAVTFPTAFAAPAYYVAFMPTGTSGNNRLVYRLNGNPTATQFTPVIVTQNNDPVTETIYYLAIGQAS